MTATPSDLSLTDGVVTLRPPDERDLEAIDQGIHDSEVVRWFGPADSAAVDVLVLNRARSQHGSPTFAVCEQGGPCVGHVWMNVSATDATSGSVGYWLLPAARGRGLATRSVRLLVPWAIESLGLRQVRLITEAGNERSQGVAHRSGFRVVEAHASRSELDVRAGEIIVFAWSPEEPDGR